MNAAPENTANVNSVFWKKKNCILFQENHKQFLCYECFFLLNIPGKDREAYQDSTTKEIRSNEKLIAFLRKDNRRKRINIAQHENVR